MDTITINEIRDHIRFALADRALSLRKQAASRKNAGPHLKSYRSGLRRDAAQCDQLAAIAGVTDPQALAGALRTHR
jgi:hypothetical protein